MMIFDPHVELQLVQDFDLFLRPWVGRLQVLFQA
jgi:hypothetical protein